MPGVESAWHPEDFADLARFVIPTAPEVKRILEEVSQAKRCPPSKMRLDVFAEALYEELARQGIRDDNEPYAAGFEQPVRFPVDVLREDGKLRVATCLDLALLFAGCAEAGFAAPLVFQFRQAHGDAHAIVGFWRVPPPTRETFYREKGTFKVGRKGNVLVVETTGVTTNKSISFAGAKRSAEKLFNDPGWELRFALDVAEARARGIMPRDIPLRVLEPDVKTVDRPKNPLVARWKHFVASRRTALVLLILPIAGLAWYAGDRFGEQPSQVAPGPAIVRSASLNGQDLRNCTLGSPCDVPAARVELMLEITPGGHYAVYLLDPSERPDQPRVGDASEATVPLNFSGPPGSSFKVVVYTSRMPMNPDVTLPEDKPRITASLRIR